MKMRLLCAVCLMGSLLISVPAVGEETSRYQELMDMRGDKSVRLTKEMVEMRPQALREAAERLGVQEAFREHYGAFQKELLSKKSLLDRMYDFTPLLLHKRHVLPPVIVTTESFADFPDPNKMIMVGKSFKILKPARFVSVPPSWRDYLLQPDGALHVEDTHPALLPLNGEESAIWRKGLAEGWKAGTEHAERLFARSMNELKRDYLGMLQYKSLSLKGYVSTPMISEGHYAIRVGDDILEFDQQTFRITAPSKFRHKDEWQE